MLDWDRPDFMAVLGVIPREDELVSIFTIEQDVLILEILMFTLEGDVTIRLHASGVMQAVLDISVLDCTFAKRERSREKSWLEFDSEAMRVKVQIEPQIRVEVHNYSA